MQSRSAMLQGEVGFYLLPWTLVVILVGCAKKEAVDINYLDQRPPGVEATLFAPGIVSTENMEHSSPAFSPDGTVVLWNTLTETYRSYLLEATLENGKWSVPHPPAFADTTADDYYPCFSPDGETLYFSSRRKMPAGYPPKRDMRIWCVKRNNGVWGQPVPVDTTVSRGQEYAHSISSDGTLYFTSSGSGATNWNIKVSKKTATGYGEPELMPYSINSVDYEDGPCIAPDQSFIIFESQRADGVDNSIDLYVSFKTPDGEWSIPVNMGPKINTPATERFARLSPDGKYLFFGSTKDQSSTRRGWDIYWIDAAVIYELRNKDLAQRSVPMRLGHRLINALDNREINATAKSITEWILTDSSSVDASVIYASTLRKQEQFQEADQFLAHRISRWGKNPALILESGLVKYGMGQNKEADQLLASELTNNDQLREYYRYLAQALLDMEKIKVSNVYFEKAMAIQPSSRAYFNRAGALANAGRTDDAFAALTRVIELGGITSRADFETSPDFQSLKSDKRWKVLMERLK